MKKSYKIVLILCLLFTTLIANVPIAQAQTLEEQRQAMIQYFMQGMTKDFTYEEVEAYISQEEANLLETGTFRNYSSYGMEGEHSTAHGIELYSYLMDYFEANTDQSTLEDLYPYQVNFNDLPRELTFYEAGGNDSPEFYVEFDDGMLTINSTKSYYDFFNGDVTHFIGPAENRGTLEMSVVDGQGNQRRVNVNTQMSVWTTAHRREFIFSFFYNDAGGVSLVLQEQENPQSVLQEFATVETFGNDDTKSEATVSTDWTLPHDWRMLSERRQDVPPVAWVLMSSGDKETIAFEPLISGEDVISGFMNPLYTFNVWTENVYSGEETPIMMGRPNLEGYFTLSNPNLDIVVGNTVRVDVFNENGDPVYHEKLDVYEYRPTALAHDSGYLTLERYFVNQDYMEGYTYPYATVTIRALAGFGAGPWETVQADADGYFYLAIPGHSNNLKTNVVSVDHPETGEVISVAPYPWTDWEYENAEW